MPSRSSLGMAELTPTSARPGVSPERRPRVSDILGPLPMECVGPVLKPTRPSLNYGGLYGARPVWAGFYAEVDSSGRAFHAPDAPRTDLGWRIKVLWIMDPKGSSPVSLAGRNTTSSEPIWFEVAESQATTAAMLDPADPENIGDGGWREFPSYLYFPSSGCYVLEGTWASGSWQLAFGFGR